MSEELTIGLGEKVRSGFYIESIFFVLMLGAVEILIMASSILQRTTEGLPLWDVKTTAAFLVVVFTPGIFGYLYRYLRLWQCGAIENGDIEHEITGIHGTFTYSVNYSVFGPLKPWAYIHGEYVFANECGWFGMMYFIIASSILLMIW